jgi:dethiobiotin synthetase
MVNDSLSLVNPYRFAKPLAPSVAAEGEGKEIRPDRIRSAFRLLSRKHAFMIVEGAGGIMVPLNDQYAFLDLAHDLHLPVLVVARPGLGTINHTVLTLMALKDRSLPIAGVVINYARISKSGHAEKTSPAIIEKMSGVRILGIVRNGSEKLGEIVDEILSPGMSRGRGR